ncbi:MAG: hypothetical protein K6A30_06480 [Lachnospiraceae bacterium]|nr:hypothetical protein [Lachnospiraceae bacterium]
MSNVVKFKKPFQSKIGGIIFALIFVYLVVLIIAFVSKKKVATYEVVKGDLSSYYSEHVLALRSEEMVKASSSGYITYFAKESTKTSAKSLVYALDQSGDLKSDIKEATEDGKNDVFSQDQKQELLSTMDDYSYNYSDNSFYNTYDFQDNVNVRLIEYLSGGTNGSASKFVKGMSAYFSYTAGYVLYEKDGMENVTIDNFTMDDVIGSNYKKTNLKQQTKVTTGDEVYKLVTSEDWYLVCEANEKLLEDLGKSTYVDVTFQSDNKTLEVPFEIVRRGNKSFMIMKIGKGVVRYAKQRYLDVDITVNTTKGFKIPTSSISKESFVKIPKEYLTQSGNSKGFLKIGKDGKVEFESVARYKSDKKYYYIHDKDLQVGDSIQMPGQSTSYTLKETAKLDCVYCVNKGYAVLKLINIINKNEDYAIVETDTSYGVNDYDHIVLDSTLIKEGEMIY